MIERLRGITAAVSGDAATLEVSGVGYGVRCGTRTASLLRVGREALMYVESVYSQTDGMRLYGFLKEEERRWFVVLRGVQGVGSRAALGMLDALGWEGLASALASGDEKRLRLAPGVGAALARRLAATLGERARELGVDAEEGLVMEGGAMEEAGAALGGLGFSYEEARKALGKGSATLSEGEREDVGALVGAALRVLGGRGVK